ncbi:unnamed protein product, partial [Mesorhabditis spiculigera]
MSLADELMNDLEEEDEVDDLDEMKTEQDDEIDEAVEEAVPLPSTTHYASVYDVAKLRKSDEYAQCMERLEKELSSSEPVVVTAPLEADPQYKLIVRLSHLAADIDNEFHVIHKFVKDKYEKRFPELDSLIPNTLEYMSAVKLLGNDINTKGQNKELLRNILQPSTVIVVSVTASTTQGQALDDQELRAVNDACDLFIEMHDHKIAMHKLVEMRMALIAPNLVELLGAATTAMLVSQAGGLIQLSRMPACNILVLGAQKRALSGFSSAHVNPHTGFLFYHPVIQTLPPDVRKKMARKLAAKVTLVARVDSLHEEPDGAYGRDMTEQMRTKIQKELEPPPVKSQKALPKPLDKASKKRGGRRVRKMKERLGMTDLRKQANRMNFGQLSEDITQDEIGFGLGQIKTGSVTGGRIRAGVVDNKTRVRMSQKLQRQVDRQRGPGGQTTVRSKVTSGTASTVTFTPVQGLEIMNPTAIEKESPSTSSYFSSSASFMHAKTPKPQ